MRILKFGGSSLADENKCKKICKNIKKIYKNDKKIIIIVSARGKTTNNLIKLAEDYGYKNDSKREYSKLLSCGENISAALFSIMLNSIGVPSKSLTAKDIEIETFGDFTNAKIAYINKTKIEKVINSNLVAVISGFQGINKDGETTTLGRGGSDTTAVAIGNIFSTNVEIYSDFDGVFSGDPRLLNFKKIKSLNYDDMSKMSESGAKVLEKQAVELAKQSNINIISKSSSKFNSLGSLITSGKSSYISISEIENLTKINLNFSNDKFENVYKNVFFVLNNFNFYSLTIKTECISFFVENKNRLEIISSLSKKLKLLKK